jgi:L-ribulokinase
MAKSSNSMRYVVGFDYGTESVRALVVDVSSGRIVAQKSVNYPHGVIDDTLPTTGKSLPADYALQHPQDWLTAVASACKRAMRAAKIDPRSVVGIGIDFTSCTMLPCLRDGTPLCLVHGFDDRPLAWPKLWKHHGAKAETDRINQIAHERKEKWLKRYGGIIGLEWFFPKLYETLNHDPRVTSAAEVWLEAGDWLVWQLTSGPFPRCSASQIVRSTCQAGYKAMWSRADGYPSLDFFRAVDPKLVPIVQHRLPGTHRSPGEPAGVLTEAAGKMLGLPPGIAVSAAVIDAHSGVPGAGVAGAGTLVMVMGTSSCHMLNSRVEKFIPGVAGVVEGGILPGYFGYETGQASVGDAFAWLVETFKLSHDALTREAAKLPPGSGGVLAIDWLNGCRTPHMDGRLSGGFIGLTLSTRPAQMYRALIEATAFGVKRIVDLLEDGGVPVKHFVASGGLPAKSPLLMQIYADVLGREIAIAESDQSVALGAAILGALAAGPKLTGHRTPAAAIAAMARQRKDLRYKPDRTRSRQYAALYPHYRNLTESSCVVAESMRAIRDV